MNRRTGQATRGARQLSGASETERSHDFGVSLEDDEERRAPSTSRPAECAAGSRWCSDPRVPERLASAIGSVGFGTSVDAQIFFGLGARDLDRCGGGSAGGAPCRGFSPRLRDRRDRAWLDGRSSRRGASRSRARSGRDRPGGASPAGSRSPAWSRWPRAGPTSLRESIQEWVWDLPPGTGL